MKEAMYYKKLDDEKVKCYLCPFECRLKEGKLALCKSRQNIKGTLYANNYGRSTSFAMDPIEKKPLFHFYPTAEILSIAANSCNLGCVFCQNWSVSQEECPTEELSPENVVDLAVKNNSIGVAYTYTEPFMWYEFVLDTARLVRERGLKNVLVTNGTVNEKPLRELLPYIDGFNIDLKSMDDHFYRKQCKSLLKPVLNTIRVVHESKSALVEITNLIIPTLNDSNENLDQLIDWLADLDPAIPLHLSSYRPGYKLKIPATPLSTMKKAYEKAIKKLHYVYLGNINIPGSSDTYCPNCAKTLITRNWYLTDVVGLDGKKCRNCGEEINIHL